MRSIIYARASAAQVRGPKVITHARWNSTNPIPASSKPVSPHVGFYKTFTRPIAKVLLIATFTYQLAYWGWVYLEKEEIKKEKSDQIGMLEKQLEELTKK
ncbi:hypothetical protein BJ878DRAFT_110868 [Calycina marina]|uniref:Inner membrane assembly complex subunit 17 n=1 Tax=Calycina marina TaxID=1763456 RepID=A0A9P7Z2E4_9HELO|nr:hypothetical protein BJ878DRAFT_110868 [Calycina marina]